MQHLKLRFIPPLFAVKAETEAAACVLLKSSGTHAAASVSVELRRPLSQGSMAHHGWGALTGRQREQSAVATVSASSESWDALDTRPERGCRHRASSERRS